ncbi:MAG: tripartite tricarboxylate transporter TctB family protein [Candidatus Heteroscillospira sp.]|jgi:hypothetical protein
MVTYKERNKKYFELVFILTLMAVSVFMLYIAQTTGMPTSDGSMSSMAFPKAVYIAILLLNAYLLAVNIAWLKRHPVDKSSEKVPLVPRKAVLTFLFICAYAAMWNVIGFTLSTFIFVLAESLMLDRSRPMKLTVLIAVIACVVMYVVFGVFFKVSFPDPLMDMIRGI